MDTRLQRSAKSAVRNRFGNNDLFLFMQSPCADYERKSAKIKLSTEELFYECMKVLDRIKENPSNALIWIVSVWNDLFNDYNDPKMGYDEEDVKTAVTEIVLCVAFCLNEFEAPFFNNLNLRLMEQITDYYPDYNEMMDLYSESYNNLGEERFRNAITTYMDSRDFYSDEIADIIQGIDSPDQLTITQSIFLFAGLLDVSLDREYTSQSKLAELIGMVTPYNAESVRTRIAELQKLHQKGGFSRKIIEDINKVKKIIDEHSNLKYNNLQEEYLM